MRPNAKTFRDFYRTRRGKILRKIIQAEIARLWPSAPAGQTVIGAGYAIPYLRRFMPGAIALMPAGQGALKWPKISLTAAFNESAMPLRDNSLERIIVIHSLEFAENPEDYIAEIARALMPGGRAIFIVPNRYGLRVAPSGKCYSAHTVKAMLRANMLAANSSKTLAYFSYANGFFARHYRILEKLARKLLPGLGGFMAIEAVKQIPAYIGPAKPQLAINPARLLPRPAFYI